MLERQMDGIILLSPQFSTKELSDVALSTPTVLVGRRTREPSLDSVVNDDYAGAVLAVEHLAGLGHRRIAHLAGPQELSTGYLRREGFLRAMEEFGLEADPELILVADAFVESEGERLCNELLDRDAEVTAILAGNDLMALGCYDAFVARGVECPEQISVVGYNDMPFAGWFNPPLTTVALPHYEIGTRAAELLLERLQDPSLPATQVTLEPSLVVRGSTAARSD
jgi:LacI family transcriptional regulator